MEHNPNYFELLAPVTLRASFVSFRTQVSDPDILLDEVRLVGRSLCRC